MKVLVVKITCLKHSCQYISLKASLIWWLQHSYTTYSLCIHRPTARHTMTQVEGKVYEGTLI